MLLLCQLCLFLGINGESDYEIVIEWLWEGGKDQSLELLARRRDQDPRIS